MSEWIELDGNSLTRVQVCLVARNQVQVRIADVARLRVNACAEFLQTRIETGAYYYGVNTGFGSNADRLLAGKPCRNFDDEQETLLDELQHKLIESHAVCVGEPLPDDVVRAMILIRINTLLRGYSGIKFSTLELLLACLNKNILPEVPALGSVGASGDLAPQSHIALMLIGLGEAKVNGEFVAAKIALQQAGLNPVRLGAKEGLALNNGTAQMLAMGVLALADLDNALLTADAAAAMTMEAFCARGAAFEERVHALRPHPGQVATAAHIRSLLTGSNLIDLPYALAPQFRTWTRQCKSVAALSSQSFDLQWRYLSLIEREGKNNFYLKHLPFKGGKKAQPQDAYSIRCVPQVHGAVRDSLAHAAGVFDIELNAVTDNPLIFTDSDDDHAVVSAGHFHGMPLALALSALKTAIVPLAAMCERRIAKMVDPATNDGLPAFLIGNEDGTDSGMMIVQYTAAAIVNDLASRAFPATAFSIPTSANTEDHVSMGANEARHVFDMCKGLTQVIGIEIFVAMHALRLRTAMLMAGITLAREDAVNFANRIDGARDSDFPNALENFKMRFSELKTIRHGFGVESVLKIMAENNIAMVEHDHYFAPSMRETINLVSQGKFAQAIRQ